MSFKTTVFSQLLQGVNRYDFKKQVSKYDGDKGTSIYSCFAILVIMVFTQIKIKNSLRDIETGINVCGNNFYHLGLKKVSRSSLSDALKTRPCNVFEDYFYHLLEEYQNNETNRAAKRLGKKKRKMRLLDSTTISMCKKKFDWAKFRSTKSGIKLHTVFDPELIVPIKVFITNAKEHDVNIVSKIEIVQGDVYVFDRGYNDYNYWHQIELGKAIFVTRLKKNTTYRVRKNMYVNKKNGVLKDQIIRIKGTKENDYPEDLRLVTYYDKETDKTLKFVTNNLKASAKHMADTYKVRWQIELFFKWIKQHLKIKKFVSTTENGVKTQIWCALITYVLILLFKQKCMLKIELYEMLRRIKYGLMERCDIYYLVFEWFKKPPRRIREDERFLW
jgi:putative transposase